MIPYTVSSLSLNGFTEFMTCYTLHVPAVHSRMSCSLPRAVTLRIMPKQHTYVSHYSHNEQLFSWTKLRQLVCVTESMSFSSEVENKVTQSGAGPSETFQNSLLPLEWEHSARCAHRKIHRSCHLKTCSVTMDRCSKQRVNEGRRAFSCIGYHMACTVAGPHSPEFLRVWILEKTHIE